MNGGTGGTGALRVERLFMQARQLLEQGDVPGSIGAYRRALELSPRLPALHAELGHALARAGDFTGALQEYSVARQLDPRDASYARSMDDLHDRSQRSQAEPIPSALVAMARAVRSTDVAPQDRPWVIAALRTALQQEPENERLHVKLSNLLLAQGDHAGATAHMREANRVSRLRTHEQE